MKKRLTALSLTLIMLFCQPFAGGTAVLAQDLTNTYGHTVAYAPIEQLYVSGEPVRYFDAQLSEWGRLGDKITRNEASSVSWLSDNGYLLNHFGRKLEASGDNNNIYADGCFNSNGEWQTKLKGPTKTHNGTYYTSVDLSDLFYPDSKLGNTSNIRSKGDLQYFFSWKVKTVQTSWAVTSTSNDYGDTYALRKTTRSIGGGWMKYNTLGDGPNLFDTTAWKPGNKSGWYISFVGMSDRDERVDSYLSGAMLVGRDIKGPSISSVRVTTDIDGKNEIENSAITLDTLDLLENRTVYFQVEWDEPVVFRDMTESDIADISLKVETLGVDGTSGIIAEAPFLRFTPSKYDSKPVMVFEYKIADPYTDSSAVTQERGYYYRFNKVTVSASENEALWNNIYDISGNRFAADENGIQPASKTVTAISGSPCVDLLPFGIKSIRMTKDENDGSAFIKAGGLLGVTLELNKGIKGVPDITDLPTVTLNIRDEGGEYITVSPREEEMKRRYRYPDGWKESGYYYINGRRITPVMLSADRRSISFYVQLIPGYTLEGASIKVTAVSSNKEKIKDSSGYSIMDYESVNGVLTPKDIPAGAESKISYYTVSPDKQYRMDFDEPIIALSAKDMGEGIISITATVEDSSIEGCDTAFSASISGSMAEGQSIGYQASSGDICDAAKWIYGEEGVMTAAFGAPITEKGKAYGFIKLPQNCEVDKITVSVAAIDEAENSASAETELALSFDTLAPTVSLSVKDEEVSVDFTDMSDDVTYSYGYSENDSDEPTYTEGVGKSAVISAPELPEGNEVFTRVLWIKARDEHGNESEITKLPVRYDRTYTEIVITGADTDKQYLTGEKPIVLFDVKNATAYWCMWAEKPARVADTAAYIAENCLEDMKNRAEDYGFYFESEDGSVTDFKNRVSELASYTRVAAIDSETELYGENISAAVTSRPAMLVIGAEREDGTTLVRTVELDTFFGAPKAEVIQSRFSTNNSNGKRVDYMAGADSARLLSASDTEYAYPFNTPSLYGFAQAEFKLSGDPVTGIDRVDMENCGISLERVVYGGADLSGEEKSREIVREWSFGEIGLDGAAKSVIVDIDPLSIEAKYFEVDGDGNRNAVRYEFSANMSYKGGVESKKIPIAYFAFNNEPSAYIYATQYDTGVWSVLSSYTEREKKNVEAVFDENGNDITPNIPVYTTATYDDGVYLRFSVSGLDCENDSDTAFYTSPVINARDTDNAAKMTMHIGTNPENLSDTVPFTFVRNWGILSDCYDVAGYLSGDESELCEVRLYYSFEYPERGTSSPIYVLTVRRDNAPPIFDISVSETERLANEVTVKLSGVYDVQRAAEGTLVIDTPEEDMREGEYFSFDAWREAAEDEDLGGIPEEDIMYGESYDEKTDSYIPEIYVRLHPDDGGIYHFTSNGYIEMLAVDNAGNRCEFALINGELVDIMPEGADFPRYYIDNVSNVPPTFLSLPSLEEHEGRFALEATADKSVKNVYLKFDDAYSKLLSESDSEEGVLFDINSVPGIISGGFDGETGKITAEIYVKPSDEVPLSSLTVVIENSTGNTAEYTCSFTSPIYGKDAEITNAKNGNGYPVYSYGETLDFSVPVKLSADGEYATSHGKLPIYGDGITAVEYTDLFGERKTENIYADIIGEAFAHSLVFTADGAEISPTKRVSSDVTVKVVTKGNVTVEGESELTFTENGTLTYTLKNPEVGTKTFTVPVTNIDKTAPEAIVSVYTDSERDAETHEQYIYSVTYTVEGFSEDGVSMIPSEDGAAPMSVTLDINSEQKEYTFRFRDTAGNEGVYTVDASDIVFVGRADNKIVDYRLTYTAADGNGFVMVGQFKSGDRVELDLINKAVSVKIEALNASGDVVSANIAANGALPNGTSLYAKEKLIMFTTESDTDRTVSLTLTGTGSGNTVAASVLLPANTIDLTPPTGTVLYKTDDNGVKAYLVTEASDLAENGVYVVGTEADGRALELKSDENGYYTEFAANGTGRFVLIDRAGNTGNVAIAVMSLDTEPPRYVSEGWQSGVTATTKEEIKKLLETPTNSTVKLFITFNEMLSRVDVKAYENGEDSAELTPTENYVTASVSGNAITVEFIENCRARLTVYDLRGNGLVLWRPEDGPIAVIDRAVPKLAEGYPVRTVADNRVTISYIFADGEEVMLLQKPDEGYKNGHTVAFDDNGTQILNFADRAGNVFTDYPVINEIDALAPNIKVSTDFVGEGNILSGNDSYKAGNLYTSKNVRILLNVEDATSDGITVTARSKSGAEIEVKREDVTANEKSYNYTVTVFENGSYTVTARDKWGNENSVEANISIIDKAPPTVKFTESAAVVKLRATEDEVKGAILGNITVSDLQSGANAPLGDLFGEVTDGVSVNVDIGGIKLHRLGSYTAKITATDRLGNRAVRDYTVNIVRDVYTFKVNGSTVYANDVYTCAKGKITIEAAADTATYFYARGYKTSAQMKYAESFNPNEGFDALEGGYYTVLVKEQGRKMYLLYVYIN